MSDELTETIFDYQEDFPSAGRIWESDGLEVGPSGNVLATAYSYLGEVSTFYAYMETRIESPLENEWVPIPGTTMLVANYPQNVSFSLKGLPPRSNVRICITNAETKHDPIPSGVRIAMRSDAGNGGNSGGEGTGGGENPSGGPMVVPV